MKLLEDIPMFPESVRKTLENEYGIETAEAFYDHAVHDLKGLRTALRVSQAEMDRLVKIVEGHLRPITSNALEGPLMKHPRGLIVDRD